MNFLYFKYNYPRKKPVKATVVMLDGVQPEATHFISSRFIASG
jgi:hypothetical protein